VECLESSSFDLTAEHVLAQQVDRNRPLLRVTQTRNLAGRREFLANDPKIRMRARIDQSRRLGAKGRIERVDRGVAEVGFEQQPREAQRGRKFADAFGSVQDPRGRHATGAERVAQFRERRVLSEDWRAAAGITEGTGKIWSIVAHGRAGTETRRHACGMRDFGSPGVTSIMISSPFMRRTGNCFMSASTSGE
jgi:hypothetical protein